MSIYRLYSNQSQKNRSETWLIAVAGVDSTIELTFSGSLIGSSILGCATSCGYNGRCLLNATSPEQPECVCDCGWSGDDCTTASGFCKVPMSYLLPGASAAIPGISDSALPVEDTALCEPNASYDITTQACTKVRMIRLGTTLRFIQANAAVAQPVTRRQ